MFIRGDFARLGLQLMTKPPQNGFATLCVIPKH
jgi:hypothetical protein